MIYYGSIDWEYPHVIMNWVTTLVGRQVLSHLSLGLVVCSIVNTVGLSGAAMFATEGADVGGVNHMLGLYVIWTPNTIRHASNDCTTLA